MHPGISFAFPILFSALAFGQETQPMKTLAFTHPVNPQEIQEVVNSLRSTGDIQRIAADNDHSAITVSGTATQLTLAEWVFQKLDQTADARPSSPAQYEVAGAPNPAVRVFYLANISTPQQVQELVNSIRGISEIQRITAYNPLGAIILRGSAKQVALAEWLVGQIDQPEPPSGAPARSPSAYAYQPQPEYPHDVGVAARVFFLANARKPQDVQEVINTIRSVTEIQRITAFNRESAIVLRGSDEAAALAEWLISRLDKPPGPQPAAAFEYQMPGTSDYQTPNRTPIVEVFYLANVVTPQAIQELVNSIRSLTHIQRLTAYNGPRAIIARGSGDQIAQATQLVQERDKPAAQ